MGCKIYVRDQSLNRIGQIDDFKRLDMIPRFNGVGTWSIELPAESDMARALQNPNYGLIVVKDGIQKPILSGPVTNPYRKWDKYGDTLTISGVDDSCWLQRRLALPAPMGPPYDVDYDVKTGQAESIMLQYVSMNLGPSARDERKIPGLTLAPCLGRGSSVTGRARFDVLIDLLGSIALQGGDLGFRIVQVDKALQFEVYQPEDKTGTAVFSPMLGNLLAFEYSSEAPEANYVIVGGSGEGTARTFLERGNSSSIVDYGRIETFRDRRDTTDQNELSQTIDEELSQKAEKNGLSITPIDTETVSFGKDYNLGDKVSVVITDTNEVVEEEVIRFLAMPWQSGVEQVERIHRILQRSTVIKDVVREIHITLTPDGGEEVAPFVGTPGATNTPNIFREFKKLRGRINSLERR